MAAASTRCLAWNPFPERGDSPAAPMGLCQSHERVVLAVGDVLGEVCLFELIFDSPTSDHVGVGMPDDLLEVATSFKYIGKIVAFLPEVTTKTI